MPRRVLVIAGSNYTDRIACSFADHLQRLGPYRCSSLGAGESRGQPGQPDYNVFESIHAFPALEWPPRTLRGGFRLVADHAASLLPSRRRRIPAMMEGLPIMAKWYQRALLESYARELPTLVRPYDVCQWMCFEPYRLPALGCFPHESKVIMAVFGSDLLRTSGVEAYSIQLQACERAARIVVPSIEMREIFLTKFGRRFSEKMRLAFLGTPMLDEVDRARGDTAAFRDRYRLPSDKIVVCVGNNGSRSNQHLAILAALAELPPRHRDRIVAVLPMTYGAEGTYLRAVREAADRSGVEFRLLDNPMSDADTARLRVCTDVLVLVPISDLFSAGLAETLYAGGVVITGAWLSYGFLRRRGIHYHEVEDSSEITANLARVLGNIAEEKEKSAANAACIRDLKSWDRVIHGWARIYEEFQ